MAEPPDEVISRIRAFTEPESEQRDRLEAAAEEIPILDLDEIQIPETNQIIGARIFERELGDEWVLSGLGAAPLSTWIRGHLQDADEDYLYRMWKRFAWFTEVEIPEYDYGDYDDLRQHVWKLHQVGLVEVVREEDNPVENRPDYRFYGAVDERLEDPAWQNVQEALYG